LTQLQKKVKAENDTASPGPWQIGYNPFFQCLVPMRLAGSDDAGQPAILSRFQGDPRAG
jgi:hypothetical protein